MLELIIVVALIILVRFWINPRNKKKNSAVEKESNSGKLYSTNIIGKSTFVLSSKEQKPALIEKQEPVFDSSGKLDIEVPLDYEPDHDDLLEEQEELERLGLQSDYSANITFDEMMLVVNEIGNKQTKTTS